MKGLAAKLHRLWLQFVLLVVYMIHLPFFLVLSRSPRLYGLLHFTRKSCSAGFMMLSGIFFDIRYATKLDSRAASVFCPNNTSYLHIPLFFLVAHGLFHSMVKYVIFVVFMIHLLFFLVLSRSSRLYGLLNFTRKSCSAGFMMLSGIFFDIRYEKKLDSRAAYVFCPNHTSYLDIPLMCLVAHGTFHFMGKEELVRNPLFRLFFRTIDISVNRDSKLSGYRALRRACENHRHGMSLVLVRKRDV